MVDAGQRSRYRTMGAVGFKHFNDFDKLIDIIDCVLYDIVDFHINFHLNFNIKHRNFFNDHDDNCCVWL